MPQKILVVSHDAGGAEILGAYIKKNPHGDSFFCILGGPAEGIFRKWRLDSLIIGDGNMSWAEMVVEVGAVDQVLTSVSWSSDLELRFIVEAKKHGVKTIAYLDHWINYRERFGYPREGWNQLVPDELWVGDEYALKKAQQEFPGVTVKVVPNLYFQEIQESYDTFLYDHPEIERNSSLVIMSEPLSEVVNTFGDGGRWKQDEYDVLDQLFQFFDEQHERRPIIIRFHPSESHAKYDKLIAYHPHLVIEKSEGKDLFYDIARGAVIIGMESMALVIAYLCRKRVISYLPDKNSQCTLPFAEIYKARSIEDLALLYAQ